MRSVSQSSPGRMMWTRFVIILPGDILVEKSPKFNLCSLYVVSGG